jgi:hypothetical protein
MTHISPNKTVGVPFQGGYDPRRNSLGAYKKKSIRNAALENANKLREEHMASFNEMVSDIMHKAKSGDEFNKKMALQYLAHLFIRVPKELEDETDNHNQLMEYQGLVSVSTLKEARGVLEARQEQGKNEAIQIIENALKKAETKAEAQGEDNCL